MRRRYFSQQGVREEPLYGVVNVSHEIDEDKVYGRLVDLRPSMRVSILYWQGIAAALFSTVSTLFAFTASIMLIG